MLTKADYIDGCHYRLVFCKLTFKHHNNSHIPRVSKKVIWAYPLVFKPSVIV